MNLDSPKDPYRTKPLSKQGLRLGANSSMPQDALNATTGISPVKSKTPSQNQWGGSRKSSHHPFGGGGVSTHGKNSEENLNPVEALGATQRLDNHHGTKNSLFSIEEKNNTSSSVTSP